MFEKQNPVDKEWKRFLKREERLVGRYAKAGQPFWEKKLRNAVPANLQEKLEEAFDKAFQVILENGTGLIEKTYSKDKLEAEYKTREYAQNLRPTGKSLTAGRKLANRQTMKNVAGAGAEGAVLGLLGIGLPDIPLFLGVVFRGLYTLALHYGIDYRDPKEQELLLELLALSLHRGSGFKESDARMNRRLYELSKRKAAGSGTKVQTRFQNGGAQVSPELIRRASRALSGELLYLKFLQGIPVAGIIGGFYDGIYLKKITDYAAIKLERRYLLGKIEP